MRDKKSYGWSKNSTLLVLAMLFVLSLSNLVRVSALPQGVSIIFNTTENASLRPADSHTAAGGSFTTLSLNVTSQTSKWKAYVGNVTGRITLDNSNNKTIYDWAITNVQGEVYVSRNNSIDFSSLSCANNSQIIAEETTLSINSSSSDGINMTFRQKVHRSFVIGGAGLILNSTCFSISTYINDASQSSSENNVFQEVLMSDGINLVFVSLLDDSTIGFDSSTYDFQMIVPDDPTEVTTTYYFYAEIG